MNSILWRIAQSAAFACIVGALVAAGPAAAVIAPRVAPSPFSGNGHNVTFDGRLFIVARHNGWEATLLRPQGVVATGGFVDVGGAFSTPILIQPTISSENAIAICEPDPARAPYRCNQGGGASGGGAYDCYDVWTLDSDALAPDPEKKLRRRRLRVVVRAPGTGHAEVEAFEWLAGMEYFTPVTRGIEPTVTRDGQLLVWQGHPINDGRIDTLVYSYNDAPCAASGWSPPKSITAMNTDPKVNGRYRIAERPLRASDGTVFAANQVFYGAYPWVFPDGEAINFTATNMPCRATEDPPGCGPRRNGLSVIGYPTNWALAHVDGDVNPDTDQTVRLFFSSPGPARVSPLPVLSGRDVWPFFGSNTSNYTELVFDDGLDGSYAGLWHMNESVKPDGNFDFAKTPDVSGYFNTGTLRDGAQFPARNNGWLGKAVVLNGTGARIEVPHAQSLNPVNAITVELWLKPTAEPNCDGNNNYRLLLAKGNIATGAYSLTFEEDRSFQARVKVGGQQYSAFSGRTVPLDEWSHIAFTYRAETGELATFVNGQRTNLVSNAPGVLSGSTDVLRIGAPGPRAACPNGDGAFQGVIDEVAISRVVRYGEVTPPGPDGGAPAPDGGAPRPDGGAPLPDGGAPRPDGGAPRPDGGAPRPDGGAPRPDGGAPRPDAGAPDAGAPDAGAPAPDAGASRPDAGASRPDAGASRPDAGASRPDAGAPPPIDGGAEVPRPRVDGGGARGSTASGCAAGGPSGGSPLSMMLLLLGVTALWFSRRRGSR